MLHEEFIMRRKMHYAWLTVFLFAICHAAWAQEPAQPGTTGKQPVKVARAEDTTTRQPEVGVEAPGEVVFKITETS